MTTPMTPDDSPTEFDRLRAQRDEIEGRPRREADAKPPRSVQVTASLGLDQLKQAMRDATINREDFDPGPWSIRDAIDLEAAASLIRREIGERQKTREVR